MLSGKKILVTGADGFIGSHLVETLLKENCNVRALAQYNSFNNLGWLEELNSSAHTNLEIISGDIRDSRLIMDVSKDMDAVFHLAALIAIPYSYKAPESYIDTNVKGTLNICQAARYHNLERVLITSTSEVYGTAQYVPIDENHPKQPQSPYSASKIAADALAMSFYYSSELPVTIVRPFNTYGPRQSGRAIIPTIIIQLLSGFKEIKLGDLSPTRDFNYISDTCKGFLSIAKSEKTIGKEINIATNSEISMQEVVNLIIDITKTKAKIIKDEQRMRPKQSEVNRLWGDNSLIKELTDFNPKFDIRTGLTKTIEWFSKDANLRQYKSAIYNI